MNYKTIVVLLWLAIVCQRESFAQSNAEVEIGSWQMVQINGGLHRLAYCREIETDADRLTCYDEFARSIPTNEEDLKQGELKPIIIKKVKPNYPAIAKQSNITGKVFVTALVGKDGKIKQIGKVTGPEVFHRVAKAAAFRTEFIPAIEFQSVWVLLPFTFSLKE